jgi:hypothetical protein
MIRTYNQALPYNFLQSILFMILDLKKIFFEVLSRLI